MTTSIGTLPLNTKSLANQLFLTPDGKVYAGKDTYYLVSSESDVLKIGNDISLLNNNANYIVSGTGSNQVRTNSELDIRYNVPTHVKNITTQNISDWGAKLSDITAGNNITIDKTDPQNPVISATDGVTSITLTGDITGAGTETIATTITDSSVTFTKLQNISRGKILGLGGGGTQTWSNLGYPSANGYTGEWSPSTVYSSSSYVKYGSVLYQASGSPAMGVPPPGSTWTQIRSVFYGTWLPTTQYTNGMAVVLNNTYYATNSTTVGVQPGTTPENTPSAVREISIGDGLAITGSDVNGWELIAGSASSIAGTILAGSNVTITGTGSQINPYIINSTGGGGGGGSTSIIGGSNITVTGTGAPATPYTINNTYSLPTGSISVKGGFRVGSGLSVSGDVLSATGTSASVFTRTVAGLVPAPGGSGTTRYLREDGAWQTVSGGGGGGVDLLTAGSSSVGAIRYSGVTKTNGQWYGGVTNPSNTTRLNFDGILHAYDFIGYGLSDRNFKENLVEIDSALAKIKSLGGYSFDWKAGNDNYSGKDNGLIAQEVQKVLPDAVVDRDGVLSIKSGNQVTALLVEAVKELSNENDELKNRVAELERKMDLILDKNK